MCLFRTIFDIAGGGLELAGQRIPAHDMEHHYNGNDHDGEGSPQEEACASASAIEAKPSNCDEKGDDPRETEQKDG